MDKEVKIETMKRLRLKEGDAIIFKCKGIVSAGQYNAIVKTMENVFNKMGIKFKPPVVILEEGMDIEVLGK